MTHRATTLILALLLATGVACGEDQSVGREGIFDFESQEGGFATTTTDADPGTETTAPPVTDAGQTTDTTAPPTTQAVQQVAAEILVGPDGSGPQFDPSYVKIFAGSIVKFTNVDSVARSVVLDDGSLDSGEIAPGASWEWTVNRVGQINYHDGTRPYAVGVIEAVRP